MRAATREASAVNGTSRSVGWTSSCRQSLSQLLPPEPRQDAKPTRSPGLRGRRRRGTAMRWRDASVHVSTGASGPARDSGSSCAVVGRSRRAARLAEEADRHSAQGHMCRRRTSRRAARVTNRVAVVGLSGRPMQEDYRCRATVPGSRRAARVIEQVAIICPAGGPGQRKLTLSGNGDASRCPVEPDQRRLVSAGRHAVKETRDLRFQRDGAVLDRGHRLAGNRSRDENLCGVRAAPPRCTRGRPEGPVALTSYARGVLVAMMRRKHKRRKLP